MKKLIAILALASFLVGFNFKASKVSDYTATTTSTQILPEKTSRRYLVVANLGNQVVYVKPASVHVGFEGFPIASYTGTWEPTIPPAEAIFIKSDSGSQKVKVIEGE